MVIAITQSGLHQAAARHHLPRAAPRRDRRDGDGAQGRGLHRAPLRRLDPRLHPVLHRPSARSTGSKVHELPARDAARRKGRAIVNLLPFAQDETVPRGHRDARLQGGRVPRLRRRKNGVVKKTRVRGVQHPAQGRRDHRDQARARATSSIGVRLTLDGDDDMLMVSRQGPGDPLPRGAMRGRWAGPRPACAG